MGYAWGPEGPRKEPEVPAYGAGAAILILLVFAVLFIGPILS